MYKNTPETFWSKVDKSGGEDACWPWTGCLDPYGVANINWQHLVFRKIASHRLAYILTHGVKLETTDHICHHCDNPPCCNPKHLFKGTHDDNVADKVKKNRQAQGEKHSKALLPNRPRGDGHYAAKLTVSQVLEIRQLRQSGLAINALAEKFNTPSSTIQKIVYRRTWTHI